MPVISPQRAHVGANGSVTFSVTMGDSHPPVYWEVAGGAAAGYINANDVFRPSSSNPLPRDNYVTVHARTYDGRDAYAFVAAP